VVLGGSNPTHEKQYDKDDQDDADDTDAAVTVAVAVAAEAATEATKQEDDKYDDKYQPDRHDLSPVAAPNRTINPHRTPIVKPMIGIFRIMNLRGLRPGIAELLLLYGNHKTGCLIATLPSS